MDTTIFKTQNEMLDKLQIETYGYFIEEYNPANGLVRDKSDESTKASIAATGYALSSYPVVVSGGPALA